MTVRIRILGDRENKANGFYCLMLKHKMYSDKLDEFWVDGKKKEVVKLLKKNKVKFEVIK